MRANNNVSRIYGVISLLRANKNQYFNCEEIHQIIQVPIQNDSQRQGLETQQELIEYEEDQDKNNMINILKRLQWEQRKFEAYKWEILYLTALDFTRNIKMYDEIQKIMSSVDQFTVYSNNKKNDLRMSTKKSFIMSTQQFQNVRNKIGAEGASDLGSDFKKCTKLSNLAIYFNKNKIGDLGASGLGCTLANCTNLSNLTLDLSSNKIGSEGLLGLCLALAKIINLKILKLYLSFNKIDASDASGLGSTLVNCKMLSNLTIDLRCFDQANVSGTIVGKG
ncbi:hypothetical protein ABPG72_017732 [Tetrahymena utriculariae]